MPRSPTIRVSDADQLAILKPFAATQNARLGRMTERLLTEKCFCQPFFCQCSQSKNVNPTGSSTLRSRRRDGFEQAGDDLLDRDAFGFGPIAD